MSTAKLNAVYAIGGGVAGRGFVPPIVSNPCGRGTGLNSKTSNSHNCRFVCGSAEDGKLLGNSTSI